MLWIDMTADHKRTAVFIIVTTLVAALALSTLLDLVRTGRPADYYSHIPLIPAISAFLLFRRRKRVFKIGKPAPYPGFFLLGFGLLLFIPGILPRADIIAKAVLVSGGAIAILSGSYVCLFGKAVSRKAFFPFAFLLFMVPLPAPLMKAIVSALVTASTGMTSLLFKAFSVPFVREGAYFHLPFFDIEVAQECSGIRSSIALVISTVLAGHIFLDRFWKKALLVLAVFPVTVLKNGVRILSLYLLSYFIDIRIIEGGFLHRSGGFIFFGLGLVILGYVLWILRMPSSVAQADRE